LKDLLNVDGVTCCAVHWKVSQSIKFFFLLLSEWLFVFKFLIFGTYLGRVHILDHQGNSVASNLTNDNQFAHSVPVNYVDVDPKGEYVASCANDGKVCVYFVCSLLRF